MQPMTQVESLEDFVRVGEAASILGVTTKTLRNWDRAGKLKARRHPVNRYRIYLRQELDALLNNSIVVKSMIQTILLDQEQRSDEARTQLGRTD